MRGSIESVAILKNSYAYNVVLSTDSRQIAFTARENDKDDIFTLTSKSRSVKKVSSNNDWKSSQQAVITNSGLAPGNDLESAILTDLAPGNYTAVVSGVTGATGVALVEAYHLQ